VISHKISWNICRGKLFMFAHFINRSLHDLMRTLVSAPTPDDREFDETAALQAAASWLIRSIDACEGCGSSKGYRFLRGWMPAYPETTGYMIPTLLMLGRELGPLEDYRQRARRLAAWLIGIQLPQGGFLGGEVGALTEPDVFDTGMILLGLNALVHEERDASALAAARKAGEFLLSSIDRNGCFVRHLSHGIVHTYNVRAAWALLGLGQLVGDNRFVDGGERNARWTLRQQNAAGFFANNAFKNGGNANTHGIAYVMRGLLQIHELTGDAAYLASVVKAARALQACYTDKGWIAAELGPDWRYLSSHICLTGYAQFAIIFYRLHQLSADPSYRRTADNLLRDVGRTQILKHRSKPYFGAIAGSFPIYGRYAPLQYPNWATKFFADALMAKRQVDRAEPRLRCQLYSG
jgi:hypothetical protein